jgi:hypothetical protein
MNSAAVWAGICLLSLFEPIGKARYANENFQTVNQLTLGLGSPIG